MYGLASSWPWTYTTTADTYLLWLAKNPANQTALIPRLHATWSYGEKQDSFGSVASMTITV